MSENISILCVDDEPISLMLLRTHFSKKYTVYTAGSGIEGLDELAKHSEVSIVLTDMKMPGMNGIEFIKKARQQHHNIVFIILTGFDITEEIMEALSNKVIHNYFRKPYNIKEIDEAIQLALKEP